MIEIFAKIDDKYITSFCTKLAKYRTELLNYSKPAVRECAERYYEIVISRMGETAGGEMVFPDTYWVELSPMWLEEKRKYGLVEEIWEATGETKDSIRVFGINIGTNQVSVFVGLKGVRPAVLEKAVQNEFGAQLPDRLIPPRPLFEPAKREMIYNDANHEWILAVFKKASQLALSAAK